jgi:hypothetical protein
MTHMFIIWFCNCTLIKIFFHLCLSHCFALLSYIHILVCSYYLHIVIIQSTLLFPSWILISTIAHYMLDILNFFGIHQIYHSIAVVISWESSKVEILHQWVPKGVRWRANMLKKWGIFPNQYRKSWWIW